MENEIHPLEDLKNDEITKIREKCVMHIEGPSTFVRSLGTVTYAICYLLSLVRMAAFLHDVGPPPFSHRQVRLLFQRYFVLGK